MSTRMSRRVAALVGAGALTAVAVLGAAAPAFATKPAPSDGEHRVPYCHATHSEKNPYVFIETDKIAVVRAHDKHQDHEDHYPGFFYLDKSGQEQWFEGRGDGAFAEEGCVGEPGGGVG